MKRIVSAVDARKRLGEILDGVYYRSDEVVIERAGKAMAVVLPMHHYERLEHARQQFFKLIEASQERNKDVPYEVIQAEVDEAIREVRAEKRAKTKA